MLSGGFRPVRHAERPFFGLPQAAGGACANMSHPNGTEFA